MFVAKSVILAVLIVTLQSVSVDSIVEDEPTERSSNSREAEPLAQTKVTPSLSSGYFGGFFDGILAGYFTPARKMCSCRCGQANNRNNQQRIVGGQTALPNQYPWTATLEYFDRFRCGATLINDRFVLTAAHCVNVWLRSMLRVTLGNHNRCANNRHEWSSYVSWTRSPPLGSWPIFGQDIALVRMDRPAPINEYISPICLPETKESHYSTYATQMGTVAGWGATSEHGYASCTLRDVDMPILSNTECFENSYYKNISNILMTDYMMCAGYPASGGYDSCQGDSGGPLMVRRPNGRYEIVGVVSWGVGCARPNYPGIYTRVTMQLNWIRRNIREGCFCRS